MLTYSYNHETSNNHEELSLANVSIMLIFTAPIDSLSIIKYANIILIKGEISLNWEHKTKKWKYRALIITK